MSTTIDGKISKLSREIWACEAMFPKLEPCAILNEATGFHLGEGRWLRDRRYSDDDINHMYEGGGNDSHYIEWMADSAWQRYLVDGDRGFLTSHSDTMTKIFNRWNDSLDIARELYWRRSVADATEYTIPSIDASGGLGGLVGSEAFRPSMSTTTCRWVIFVVSIKM